MFNIIFNSISLLMSCIYSRENVKLQEILGFQSRLMFLICFGNSFFKSVFAF
jgi:hypothetical protein